MRKGSKVALISVAALLAIVLLFMGTMAIQVGRHVEMHLITWNGEDNEVFRTQAPIWLLGLSGFLCGGLA